MKSLYTNIPNYEGITAVRETSDKSKSILYLQYIDDMLYSLYGQELSKNY